MYVRIYNNSYTRRIAAAMAVLHRSLSQYKSSLYETCRTLLHSRTTKAERAAQLATENERLRRLNQQLVLDLRQARDDADQCRQLYEQTMLENRQFKERPIQLPSDLPAPGNMYGPKMICLCVLLARRLGFRSANAALVIVFDFLKITNKVPSHDSIRLWACRIGVAITEEEEKTSEGEIWISDHSNQIGQDKVLVISRLRQEDLPRPGKTLSRSRLKVIATIVGKSWKREDVRREYEKLAMKRGAPTWLLSDGAVELHESVDALDKHAKNDVRRIRDIKHKGANILEKLIGKDPQFVKFLSMIGTTRSQIQQTELGHFTPPAQKTKARFMNLGSLLKWAEMALFHLNAPDSKARAKITVPRMNQKLGWLLAFGEDLARWSACHAVMKHCLNHLERYAVEKGTVATLELSLQEAFGDLQARDAVSAAMADGMLHSISEIELQLKAGERVWALSDNLESVFGGFKRLERQHSKGGFTSLVAALPILTEELTPQRVRECLASVSVKHLRKWVTDNLGKTVTAKRQLAFHEFATHVDGAAKYRLN